MSGNFSLNSFQSECQRRNFSDTSEYKNNKKFLSEAVSGLQAHKMGGKELGKTLSLFKEVIAKLSECEKSIEGPSPSTSNPKEWDIPLRDLIRSVREVAKKEHVDFQVATSPVKRFQQVARSVMPIAKGANVPGTRLLKEECWLEALGIRFKIGDVEIQDHVYISFFTHRTPFWDDWLTKIDKQGIPYRSQYSFSEYFNTIAAPKLSEEEKARLIAESLQTLEYYNDPELSTLQVSFDAQGRAQTKGNALNEWTQILTSKSDFQLQSYREFLHQRDAPPLERPELVCGRGKEPFAYVLTSDGILLIAMKQKGKTQHTSLSQGRAVLSAGFIHMNGDGTVVSLVGYSGHYVPTKTQMLNMLEFLQKQNVDVEKIRVEVRSADRTSSLIEPGSVSAWIRAEREELIQQISTKDQALSETILTDMSYGELAELAASKSR